MEKLTEDSALVKIAASLKSVAKLVAENKVSSIEAAAKKFEVDRLKLKVDVHLAEFNSLRDEMQKRLGYQIASASLAVPYLGALILAATKLMEPTKLVDITSLIGTATLTVVRWETSYSMVFQSMSIGCSVLGLFACNQDVAIQDISLYLNSELKPKLDQLLGFESLGWESHVRKHRTRKRLFARMLASGSMHFVLIVCAVAPLIWFLACALWGGNASRPGEFSYVEPSPAQWIHFGVASAFFCSLLIACLGVARSYMRQLDAC